MTWNVLKWVAIAAMLIDHTAAVMGGLFPFSWYDPMRDVGRIAFPIFAYGIAQGCVYTHSARRYLGRLLLFAVLSEIPYRLALRAGSLAFGLFNVFFTLLAGAACCQLVKFCRSKGRRWAWAAVAPVPEMSSSTPCGSISRPMPSAPAARPPSLPLPSAMMPASMVLCGLLWENKT